MVYRKDDPAKVLYQSPSNTAFQRYYYSQPLPEGGQDNNSLEDLFSKLEGNWPAIVQRLSQHQPLDGLEELFTFVALQRVRVPASRDAMELMQAEQVKATIRVIEAAEKLPAKPPGFENLNIADVVNVSIDPHQSIHGMATVLQGLEQLLNHLGFAILHNTTEIAFLTSDNPVIWFDHTVAEDRMRPYAVQPDGPMTLVMPLSPTLLLYGHSDLRDRFVRDSLIHSEMGDRQWIKTANRLICKFAYEAVFASAPGHEKLIERYAMISPVLETVTMPTESGGFMILHQQVFGQRTPKAKWKP